MISLFVDNCRGFLQGKSSYSFAPAFFQDKVSGKKNGHTSGKKFSSFLFPGDRKKKEYTARSLTDHIPGLIDSLRQATSNAERNFLKLGDDMQAIYGDTTNLAQQIFESMRIIDADDGSGILQELRSLIEESLVNLSGCQREGAGKEEIIKVIASEVAELERYCNEAQRMATYLTVIGFNIRIESAQRDEFDKLFGVIAEEIKKSSDKIVEIIGRIENDARLLCRDQEEVSHQIAGDLLQLKKLADEADEVVKQAFLQIKQLMGVACAEMGKAGEYSNDLSRQIGEIVMGIQLHDSMNQRIEHIIEALQDVGHLLGHGSEAKFSNESFNKVFKIITLQIAQLEYMANEVEEVYASTEKAFASISVCIDNLTGSLEGFGQRKSQDADLSQQGKNDPFASLTNALSELDDLLKSGDNLIAGVDSSAARSAEAAGQLSQYLKQIQDISFQTRLIGLNSIVNAARLGDKGKIFEVLSNQLTGMTEYSENFVHAVERIITSIRSHIESAQQQENPASDHESGQSLSIGEVIEHASKRYTNFNVLSVSTGAKAEELKESLFQVQEELAFLGSLEAELKELASKTESLREILSPWASSGQQDRDNYQQELIERYTMKQERDIHQNILAVTDPGSVADDETDQEEDDVVLFFDDDTSDENTDEIFETPMVESSVAEEEGQLDDNIQLF